VVLLGHNITVYSILFSSSNFSDPLEAWQSICRVIAVLHVVKLVIIYFLISFFILFFVILEFHDRIERQISEEPISPI
jgi:hypothetical protein